MTDQEKAELLQLLQDKHIEYDALDKKYTELADKYIALSEKYSDLVDKFINMPVPKPVHKP